MALNASTLYIPVVTPPTPAPSPGPSVPPASSSTLISNTVNEFSLLPSHHRRQFLSAIITNCTPDELLFVSTTVAPLLQRDFLRDLPPEIATYVLSFIDDPKSLLCAGRVSRYWNELVTDEWLWRRMCTIHEFKADADEWEFDPDEPLSLPVSDPSVIHNDDFAQAIAALPGTSSRPRPMPPSPISPSALERFCQAVSALPPPKFSYRTHFKQSYTILNKWRRGGTLLRRLPLTSHQHLPNDAMQPPVANPSSAVPTSIALDSDWVVVGLANSRIHIFSARTGVSCRTLVGHTAGVWAVALVKAGGERIDPSEELAAGMQNLNLGADAATNQNSVFAEYMISPAMRTALGLGPLPGHSQPTVPKPRYKRKSVPPPPYGRPGDPSGTSEGWGQPNSLVVSGGCDKDLRVWDVLSGFCIYILKGHTSTIRCLKVLHNRPIAVTGSRDRTLRVWDIQRGRCLRVLEGHEDSVRTLDVCGNRVASGSYDFTCRLWDVDTGQCIHVFRGHHHQIYTVAFDGIRVVSGGMDTTVRVWDVETGACSALLQGHTALVCQLQLSSHMLVTGGSDGRVIIFSMLPTPVTPATSPDLPKAPPSTPKLFAVVQRLVAHDSSVTGLQFDSRFLVTGGNDGRVRLFEFHKDPALGGSAGIGGKFEYVREMSDPCESVWKIAYTDRTVAVLCKRAGKTQVEIWSFDEPAVHLGMVRRR